MDLDNLMDDFDLDDDILNEDEDFQVNSVSTPNEEPANVSDVTELESTTSPLIESNRRDSPQTSDAVSNAFGTKNNYKPKENSKLASPSSPVDTPTSQDDRSYQCEVCEMFFTKKDFYHHRKNVHPPGMKETDEYRSQLKDLNTTKRVEKTFFEQKSPSHGLILNEDDRQFAYLSGFQQGLKKHKDKKQKKKKVSRFASLSRPLDRTSITKKHKQHFTYQPTINHRPGQTKRSTLTKRPKPHSGTLLKKKSGEVPIWKDTGVEVSPVSAYMKTTAFRNYHIINIPEESELLFHDATSFGRSVMKYSKIERELRNTTPTTFFDERHCKVHRAHPKSFHNSIFHHQHTMFYAEQSRLVFMDHEKIVLFNMSTKDWRYYPIVSRVGSPFSKGMTDQSFVYLRQNQCVYLIGGMFLKNNEFNHEVYKINIGSIIEFDNSFDRESDAPYPAVSWREVKRKTIGKPTHRIKLTAEATHDHNIVIYGGETRRRKTDISLLPLPDIWLYNVRESSWHRLPAGSCQPPRRHSAGSTMVGSKLVIHGGIGRYDVMLSDMWLYDLEVEQWQLISNSTNIARFHHNLHVFPLPYSSQAKAILFGGHGDATNVVYSLETSNLSYGNDLSPIPHLTPSTPFQDVVITFTPKPAKKKMSIKQTLRKINTQAESKEPFKMKELAQRPKTPELQLNLDTPRKKRQRPSSARPNSTLKSRMSPRPSPRRFTKTQRPSSARPKTTRTQLLRQKKKQEEKLEALKKVYFTHVYKTHDRIIVDRVDPDKVNVKPPSPENEPDPYNYEDHPSLWDTLENPPPDNTQFINHKVTRPSGRKKRLIQSPNHFDSLSKQSYRYASTTKAASPVYTSKSEHTVMRSSSNTFSYQSESLIDVEQLRKRILSYSFKHESTSNS